MVKRFRSTLAVRLGHNISARRKQLEWTQEYLAERLKLGTATLARYEAGTTTPSLATLEDVATALDITMGELLANEKHVGPLPECEKLAAWLHSLAQDDVSWVLSVVQQLLTRCKPQQKRPIRRGKAIANKSP
jgi:transcriptional regulator with XRE-family HTH domain